MGQAGRRSCGDRISGAPNGSVTQFASALRSVGTQLATGRLQLHLAAVRVLADAPVKTSTQLRLALLPSLIDRELL
jgi:hypothetical protein